MLHRPVGSGARHPGADGGERPTPRASETDRARRRRPCMDTPNRRSNFRDGPTGPRALHTLHTLRQARHSTLISTGPPPGPRLTPRSHGHPHLIPRRLLWRLRAGGGGRVLFGHQQLLEVVLGQLLLFAAEQVFQVHILSEAGGACTAQQRKVSKRLGSGLHRAGGLGAGHGAAVMARRGGAEVREAAVCRRHAHQVKVRQHRLVHLVRRNL